MMTRVGQWQQWKEIEGCCGSVIIIIIIRSQSPRRECNAETTDDEDGDVDVGGKPFFNGRRSLLTFQAW